MIKNTAKWEHSCNSLESFIAVITSLKLLSLPHPSVTYFNVIGETIERYFYKEFSYSIDGLFFTPFQELTADNLQLMKNLLYL